MPLALTFSLGLLLAAVDLVLITNRGTFSSTPNSTPSSTVAKPSTPSPTPSIEPYLINVDYDGDVDTAGQSGMQSAMFPQGKFPEGVAPESDNCNTWYAWSKERGAVDWSSTMVAFTLSATIAPVRVHGVRIRREKLAEEGRGEAASCRVGEQPMFSYLGIDLDDGTSSFFYPAPENLSPAQIEKLYASGDLTDDNLMKRPFALEIQPGQKSDRVLVTADSEDCYCAWALELKMEVGGRRFTHVIDHDGEPFVTAPKDGSYVLRMWDADSKRWCRDVCP